MIVIPLLEGSSDEIIEKNIKMLIDEGKTPEQASAIAYEKAGRSPKANASEPTYEYLKKVWQLLMEHQDVFDEIKAAIHQTAKSSAGGQIKAKNMMGEDPPMKANASQMGGKVIEANDQITVVPVVMMKERVTNGALKPFEEFAGDAAWLEGVPIVPPHDPNGGIKNLVTHKTLKAGKIRNVKVNTDLKRIEGEAVLFNDRIAPGDLERIKNGEMFGGSIGYFSDEEVLSEPRTWTDGTVYNSIERGPFFFDHFSLVSNGACPLPECGLNVNAQEPIPIISKVDDMTEPVVTPPAGSPAVTVEPPVVEVPKVNVQIDGSKIVEALAAFELKANARFDALDKAIAEKDAKIKTLEQDLELRTNAQRASEDALVLTTLTGMLLDAHKDKAAEFLPAFKANAALFIAQNPDKIDLNAFAKQKIEPAGQPFVPHVNADDDAWLKSVMPTDEEAGLRKVA